jgi:hypothetical protein
MKLRKCSGRYCNGDLAVSTTKYPRCRRCYREEVRQNIERVCVSGPECVYNECLCLWEDKKKKYFKHRRKAQFCAMCGVKIKYLVLWVMDDGRFEDGPNLCYCCVKRSDKVENIALAKHGKRSVPKVEYAGIAYRIENAEGIGPFRTSITWRSNRELVYSKAIASSMGVPQDEGIYGGLFAFTSMEALEYYVPSKLLKYLLDNGYRLKLYKRKASRVKIFDRGLQLSFVKG